MREVLITDGGIETTLIFHDGVELPEFAAFPLLDSPDGRAALKRYFGKRRLVRLTCDAVRIPGAALRLIVRTAKDGDVVTDLDLAAEEVILARLRTHFPHERIVSEEAGLLEADGSRTWLVDPLDGSNNVAIGLTANDHPVGMNTVHCEFVDDALEFLWRPDDSDARNGAADQFRIALEHGDNPALARAAGLEQFHVE